MLMGIIRERGKFDDTGGGGTIFGVMISTKRYGVESRAKL